MLCQECQNSEATVHIIESFDGKRSEYFLCRGCARSREDLDIGSEGPLSLQALFSSLLDGVLAGVKSGAPLPGPQCPECKLTFEQFRQVGRFGCSHCLQAFAPRLEPLLKRMHSGTEHRGRVPRLARRRVGFQRELTELRRELERSVVAEEFEEAARLRDRIRALEGKIAVQEELNPSCRDEGGAAEEEGRP